MSFDDIPEDTRESFPCQECYSGDVTLNDDGWWECSECDFKRKEVIK